MLSYDVVLYDGTPVTASPTEHSDLYWALKGGGSGFGVITSLTTAVISAPEEASKFTYVNAVYQQTQNEAREFLKRFQDFLMPDLPIGSKEYKEKVRATSAKFGGGAGFFTSGALLSVSGLFLGSAEEAESTFDEAGLLDSEILGWYPPVGRLFFTHEFSSYADAQLFTACLNMATNGGLSWTNWVNSNGIYNETDNSDDTDIHYRVDICEDLGIESKYCYQTTFGTIPNCDPTNVLFSLDDVKNVILPALKRVAIEPQSWLNRPGGQRMAEAAYEEQREGSQNATVTIITAETSLTGGLLHGRLHPNVLLEMANVGVQVNHFAHGKHSVIKMEKSYDFDSCFSDCVHLLIFTLLLLLPYSLSLFIV